MPRLKHAQYWVLENILNKLPLHTASHGFVKGRSIVSNAQPHVGQAIVINMDLKNFFPTLTYKRVKGLIKSFGYSEQIATIVGLMLTEPQCDEVELHDRQYFIARGERLLPQGSPASPAVSNLTCRSLDHRLAGMANKLGFAYTRYADDMTFSAPDQSSANELTKLLWRARSIVKDEGFIIHPDKTRIMRKGVRQEVTGIVVNSKPSIDRAKVRRFRAALHTLEQKGWDAVSWEGSNMVPESMMGFANYLVMVDPELGIQYRDRLRAVGKHSPKHVMPSKYNNNMLRESARSGKAPDWWKPAERDAPVLEKTQQQLNNARRAANSEKQSRVKQERASGHRQNQDQAQNTDEAPKPWNNEQQEKNNAEQFIDPATGRFRPSIGRSLLSLGLFLAVSTLSRNPLPLLIGAFWVALSYFLWRQPVLYRVAIMLFGIPALFLLVRLIFRL